MKNAVLILAIVLLSSFTGKASSNTLEGNTLSEFGHYKVTEAEYVVIDDVAYKSWDLTYSGSDKSYKVLYSPASADNCCFLVKGEGFEIKYAKKDNGFGVELVEPGKRTVKKRDVMNQIEYDKFVNQLLLTSKDKTVEEYLGLVAAFMPLLFS